VERLNRNQTLWLARGAALGRFLRRMLQAWHAGLDWLCEIGAARGRLPKRP
jgi:hypothetical protein